MPESLSSFERLPPSLFIFGLTTSRGDQHRSRDGAARPGDDVIVLVNEIVDLGIGFGEPRTVVAVALVLQVADDAGPVVRPPMPLR